MVVISREDYHRMSDYFLHKFWQDVKDPAWPDITTYDEFNNLDKNLINECFQQHGLKQRLAEIENLDYWRLLKLNTATEMFKKDNFVFFNVSKCGSRHYYEFFVKRLGWKRYSTESFDELKGLIKFGLMMHPLERYLKGLTEFLWELKIADQINLESFVTSCYVPDQHSASYHLMFGEVIHDIHWIPFKSMEDREVKQCINSLFSKYGSSICIPVEHPPKHVSSPEKKLLYKTLAQHWLNRPELKKPPDHIDPKKFENLYLIYHTYSQDLGFYRSLIDSFRPDWSHIKT